MSGAEAALVLDDITRRVGGELHIESVSMSLARGSLNVLLGPTLSGKTSLMRLMAGLDRPTEGRVYENGVDVTGLPVRQRSVAMVYQQFVNYPSLTVFENIASPLRVAGLGRSEIEERVRRAATLLRLEPMLQRVPGELSGGQQQRTAIARALVKQASLVLLDEPLANLDYKLREELREELPKLFAESGSVLVYATTEPLEALLLGGATATLREGRVAQFGPTAGVYRNPANLAAARAFSDPPLNELPLTKAGGRVLLAADRSLPAIGPLEGLADGAYTLAFRAEALKLGPEAEGKYGFTGTVTVTEVTGSESFIHLDAGSGAWVAVVPGVHEALQGERLALHLDPRSGFVFDRLGERANPATLAVAA